MKQNTDEWYESRKNYIGASEASTVLGLNPWKTAFELWQEKTGIIEPSRTQNKAMREGTLKEPIARKFYNELYGFNCVDTIFISEDYPFMRASLDGYDKEKNKAVEIKCPQARNFKKASAEVAIYYYCQLQHQMVCANLKEIDYFVYLNEDNLSLIKTPLDPVFAKNMVEKESVFWEHVLTKTPPKNKKDSKMIENVISYEQLSEHLMELDTYIISANKDKRALLEKMKTAPNAILEHNLY